MSKDDDFGAWHHEIDKLFNMVIRGGGNHITWGNTALSDLDTEALRALFNLVRTPDAAAGFPHIAQAYVDAQTAIMAEFEERGITLVPSIRIVVDNARPKPILSMSPEGPKGAA